MKNFVEQVTKEIKKIYPEAEVTIERIVKNNGVVLHGMLIHCPNENVSPVFYMEHYYEHFQAGTDLKSIVKKIVELYEQNCSQIALSKFNFHNAQKHLKYKVVNTEKNIGFLSKVPHIAFLDLSIVFYISVSIETDGIGTAVVTNQLMDKWGTTRDKLFKIATENMKQDFYFKNMAEVIKTFIDDGMTDVELPMYVLTNSQKMYGAALIASDETLERITDILNLETFIILPSSVHEVIILTTAQKTDVYELREMVASVNSTQVAPEEILSDNVYCYERGKGIIIL